MGCGILFPATDDTVLSNLSESDSDVEQTAEFVYEEDDQEGVWSGSDSGDFLKQLHVKYRAVMKQKSQVKGEKRTKTKETGSVCTVYFTKNGERVGSVECSVPRGGFYPVVAMLSGGEKIRVNFEMVKKNQSHLTVSIHRFFICVCVCVWVRVCVWVCGCQV